MKHETKPLKYKSLPGLSEKQLKEHHDVLYAGYVNKLNEIEEKLEKADKTSANATFSDFRELKKEEVFSTNAIYLHEGYFDNLNNDTGKIKPSSELAKLIERDFDSYEKWETDFRACGMVARGWVVLAYNLDDNKLHNYTSDVHDVGGVWSSIPILVLDVYEHAYFIDYQTGRKNYLETFMKNIDWLIAADRLDKILKLVQT